MKIFLHILFFTFYFQSFIFGQGSLIKNESINGESILFKRNLIKLDTNNISITDSIFNYLVKVKYNGVLFFCPITENDSLALKHLSYLNKKGIPSKLVLYPRFAEDEKMMINISKYFIGKCEKCSVCKSDSLIDGVNSFIFNSDSFNLNRALKLNKDAIDSSCVSFSNKSVVKLILKEGTFCPQYFEDRMLQYEKFLNNLYNPIYTMQEEIILLKKQVFLLEERIKIMEKRN